MNASKVATIIVVGTLAIIAWYVNSILQTSQQPSVEATNVERFVGLLTDPNAKVTANEEARLSKVGSDRSEWIRLDKEHFSLYLPANILATYGDVYLSIYQNSPITCGQVKFDARAEEWGHFIASRRANVALIEGDNQLSDKEFLELYPVVCQY